MSPSKSRLKLDRSCVALARDRRDALQEPRLGRVVEVQAVVRDVVAAVAVLGEVRVADPGRAGSGSGLRGRRQGEHEAEDEQRALHAGRRYREPGRMAAGGRADEDGRMLRLSLLAGCSAALRVLAARSACCAAHTPHGRDHPPQRRSAAAFDAAGHGLAAWVDSTTASAAPTTARPPGWPAIKPAFVPDLIAVALDGAGNRVFAYPGELERAASCAPARTGAPNAATFQNVPANARSVSLAVNPAGDVLVAWTSDNTSDVTGMAFWAHDKADAGRAAAAADDRRRVQRDAVRGARRGPPRRRRLPAERAPRADRDGGRRSVAVRTAGDAVRRPGRRDDRRPGA